MSSFYESTAWKVSKYGVVSGPYFPVFDLKKLCIWTLFTQWRARIKGGGGIFFNLFLTVLMVDLFTLAQMDEVFFDAVQKFQSPWKYIVIVNEVWKVFNFFSYFAKQTRFNGSCSMNGITSSSRLIKRLIP